MFTNTHAVPFTTARPVLPVVRVMGGLVAAMLTVGQVFHRLLGSPDTEIEEPVWLDPDAPRDSVLVIDASPSMDFRDWLPSRLHGAKDSAGAFITRLRQCLPSAAVAIVTYAYQARLACPLTSVEHFDRLYNGIRYISTSSYTNITAGLEMAERALRGSRRAQQVVLLTDGGHNTGIGPKAIAAKLRKHAILECVGIGSRDDIDEELLTEIASAHPDGRKRYRWIGDKEGLVEHFERLAGGITREP